jgi:hypothetical protein
MAESALGTFRVDKDLWAKFQELAKSGDSNASKLIVGFIEACVDNRIDIKDYTSIKPKSKSENLSEIIDEYLDKHLDKRIDLNLEVRIDEYLDKHLEKRLDVCLDKSDFSKTIDRSVEVALESKLTHRLAAVETEITNIKMALSNVPSPQPLALESPQKVESVATNPDPTNWEGSIAELASTGMSSRQIADRLNLLGFTTTKGKPFSRQSIESYLGRRPDLKAIYENARKKGD